MGLRLRMTKDLTGGLKDGRLRGGPAQGWAAAGDQRSWVTVEYISSEAVMTLEFIS
ncbi:hypothetical protein GCM10011505_03900 [Tistrella bauzanensis]|uniref:F5/8 type C domain-containing protein n=1 Tax=Tistrella bauzanensis TaxID=657419 RepID=A0ABQ1I7Z2_9PROT|nr:hypothetical protein GCM10011505_03900 [Tistrella bauzanensis]